MEIFDGLLGGGQAVQAPAPPAPPPPVPTIDQARQRRDAADMAAKKKGQAASVLTGPEGVGATPLQTKTLIGS